MGLLLMPGIELLSSCYYLNEGRADNTPSSTPSPPNMDGLHLQWIYSNEIVELLSVLFQIIVNIMES